MFCGEDVGTLWPKPTGQVTLANDVVKIDLDKITIKSDSFKMAPAYWTMAESRFYEMQRKKKSDKVKLESGGKEFNIEVISETDNMGKWIKNFVTLIQTYIFCFNIFSSLRTPQICHWATTKATH